MEEAGNGAGHPANKRTAPRVDAEFEVGSESENNFYQGLSENLSSGGLFFETYAVHQVGEQMRVRFTLPGSLEPLECEVVVRWIRELSPTSDTSPGVGVEFVALAADARRAIEQFMRARSPLFFDAP